jgi:hypothetical protein
MRHDGFNLQCGWVFQLPDLRRTGPGILQESTVGTVMMSDGWVDGGERGILRLTRDSLRELALAPLSCRAAPSRSFAHRDVLSRCPR